MTDEIVDIEARLRDIFNRVDALLKESPSKRVAMAPPVSPVDSPPESPVETPQEPLILPPMAPAEVDSEEKDKFEIPYLIGFPAPHYDAAQKLWDTLQRLEPKFTAKNFYLSGKGSIPYTLGQPLFITAFSQAHIFKRGALLLITENRLSKDLCYPFSRELARCGFYFQEVSPESVNYPEFYDEFLLGLAFFMTTQKSLPHS